jgi:hypothetical protein
MNQSAVQEAFAPPPPKSITKAWIGVVRDPGQFIWHWNYKGAILSASLRAPVFLITYLVSRESVRLALAAAAVQFVFRFFFAGLSGAFIQSFRRVEPPWKAFVSIVLLVPIVSHLFEYLVQAAFVTATGTTDLTNRAILRSVCVSVISTLFVLFVMRRNVLIVGERASKSLASDLRRIPWLIFEFVMFIPHEIAELLRRRQIISALAALLGFGIFSELIVWGVTEKTHWTYGGGQTIPVLNIWGVDGMIIMLIAVFFAFAVFPRDWFTSRQP